MRLILQQGGAMTMARLAVAMVNSFISQNTGERRNAENGDNICFPSIYSGPNFLNSGQTPWSPQSIRPRKSVAVLASVWQELQPGIMEDIWLHGSFPGDRDASLSTKGGNLNLNIKFYYCCCSNLFFLYEKYQDMKYYYSIIWSKVV